MKWQHKSNTASPHSHAHEYALLSWPSLYHAMYLICTLFLRGGMRISAVIYTEWFIWNQMMNSDHKHRKTWSVRNSERKQQRLSNHRYHTSYNSYCSSARVWRRWQQRRHQQRALPMMSQRQPMKALIQTLHHHYQYHHPQQRRQQQRRRRKRTMMNHRMKKARVIVQHHWHVWYAVPRVPFTNVPNVIDDPAA